MPFTLAHPAAVLPLRRMGLPMSALVAGSMLPDVPVFFGHGVSYEVTHSWLGVFVVVPILTLLVLPIWFTQLRDPLVDVLPDALRQRLPPTARLTRHQWSLVFPAAVLGVATHVAWDTFTHSRRWGTRQVEWLHTQHAGLLGFNWAQYVSGIVGLLVTLGALGVWFSRQPQVPRPRLVPQLGTSALWGAVLLSILPAGAAFAHSIPHGFHAVAFNSVVIGMVSLTAALIALCVAWQIVVRRADLSVDSR